MHISLGTVVGLCKVHNEVGKLSPLPTVGGDVIYIKNDGCRLSGGGEIAICYLFDDHILVWVPLGGESHC
jgi:hypothetical protein